MKLVVNLDIYQVMYSIPYSKQTEQFDSIHARHIINGVLPINGCPDSIVLFSKNNTIIKSMTMCFKVLHITKEIKYEVNGLFDKLSCHKKKVGDVYHYDIYIDKFLKYFSQNIDEIRFEFLGDPIERAYVAIRKIKSLYQYFNTNINLALGIIQRSRVDFDEPCKNVKVRINSGAIISDVFINSSNNKTIISIEQILNTHNVETMDKVAIDESMRKLGSTDLINLSINDLSDSLFDINPNCIINMSKVDTFDLKIESNEYISFIECFIYAIERTDHHISPTYITCNVSNTCPNKLIDCIEFDYSDTDIDSDLESICDLDDCVLDI